jgi:hypothetical protein
LLDLTTAVLSGPALTLLTIRRTSLKL